MINMSKIKMFFIISRMIKCIRIYYLESKPSLRLIIYQQTRVIDLQALPHWAKSKIHWASHGAKFRKSRWPVLHYVQNPQGYERWWYLANMSGVLWSEQHPPWLRLRQWIWMGDWEEHNHPISNFKDTFELKDMLDTLNLPPNARRFTSDATSMYTNIQTEPISPSWNLWVSSCSTWCQILWLWLSLMLSSLPL
jgi:hypothetical protein